MPLAALEAVRSATVLLQTIPHSQQSGEVFADARLRACTVLAPRTDRAWLKTFSSSSSSLKSQSSALIRALESASLPPPCVSLALLVLCCAPKDDKAMRDGSVSRAAGAQHSAGWPEERPGCQPPERHLSFTGGCGSSSSFC